MKAFIVRTSLTSRKTVINADYITTIMEDTLPENEVGGRCIIQMEDGRRLLVYHSIDEILEIMRTM
jgi:uncharacterized protein YlzI (FlbEa/FlbD family)